MTPKNSHLPILEDNTRTLYDNNNKNLMKIFESVCIKNKRPNKNKTAFNTGTNLLNIVALLTEWTNHIIIITINQRKNNDLLSKYTIYIYIMLPNIYIPGQ